MLPVIPLSPVEVERDWSCRRDGLAVMREGLGVGPELEFSSDPHRAVEPHLKRADMGGLRGEKACDISPSASPGKPEYLSSTRTREIVPGADARVVYALVAQATQKVRSRFIQRG